MQKLTFGINASIKQEISKLGDYLSDEGEEEDEI